MADPEIREYVWTRAFGAKRPVSPFFDTPEEAGDWLRSAEGRAVCANMLFGPYLRVRIDYNNVHLREARPEEWQRARASTSTA